MRILRAMRKVLKRLFGRIESIQTGVHRTYPQHALAVKIKRVDLIGGKAERVVGFMYKMAEPAADGIEQVEASGSTYPDPLRIHLHRTHGIVAETIRVLWMMGEMLYLAGASIQTIESAFRGAQPDFSMIGGSNPLYPAGTNCVRFACQMHQTIKAATDQIHPTDTAVPGAYPQDTRSVLQECDNAVISQAVRIAGLVAIGLKTV